jgi:hypothetical protein
MHRQRAVEAKLPKLVRYSFFHGARARQEPVIINASIANAAQTIHHICQERA